MNLMEEEYKNRFKNSASLQGIDADKLWEGITETIDEIPLSSKPANPQQKSIRWAALLLLLIVLASLFYYQTKTPVSSNSEQATTPANSQNMSNDPLPYANQNTDQILKNNKGKISTENNIKTLPKNIQNTNTDQAIKSTSLKNENKTTNLDPVLNAINETPIKDKTLKNNISQSNKAARPKDSRIKDEFTTIENSQKNIGSIKSLDTSNNNLEGHLVDKKPTPLSSNLELRPFNSAIQNIPTLSFFIESENSKSLEIFYLKSPKLPQVKKSDYFQFATSTGINSLFLNHKKGSTDGSFMDELKDATTSKLGWSNSFRISWIRNNHFSINSGIDHDLIRLRFFKRTETPIIHIDDNYLVYFEIDPQSRDTINQTYDTVELDALNKRRVLHHNKFNLVSIPLEFGFQNQKGKLGYGINIGISANFFLSQKGKTINEMGEIYVIDDTVAEQLPFKKSFIAYQVNPFVDYQLSKHLKFRLNPVLKYQSLGKSSLYNLDQHSVMVGLNGGLVFRLD